MPRQRLRRYLDEHHIKYVAFSHSRAFTAQKIAASAHIPGQELAKTVIVKLNGELAMAVLPASSKINFALLRDATGAEEVQLAGEADFAAVLPDCEVGSMPPFGNLYQMPTYVDRTLAADELIAFNAGSHTELIQMSYRDFIRLANPKVVALAFMAMV
jgi:Ala-tRNA(Pro) deacylase